MLSRLFLVLPLVVVPACGGDGSDSDGAASSDAADETTETGGMGGQSDAYAVCEAHCECEGCAGNWVDDCAKGRETTRAGCEAEWDALYACFVENMTCTTGSFHTDGCGAEDTVLRDCTMG